MTCSQHNKCISTAITAGEKICSNNGLRFTDIRRQVFSIIWESHIPSKAYDILDKLKETGASAKAPTVYRALDFLLENGLIHRINSLNAYAGCGHPAKHKQCYFLICTECAEVTECCTQSLTRAIKKIGKENHFSKLQTSLEIQGICAACSSESSH